jgi:hypothetical protein
VKQIIGLIFLISLLGCSSKELRNPIKITSEPSDVKVEYFDFNKNQFEELGQTPLTLKSEEIKELEKQRSTLLKLSRPGYVIEKIYIDLDKNESLKVHSNMSKIEMWVESEDYVNSKIANKITGETRDIYKSIMNKNYKTALETTDKMIKKFPMAHIFYDIKASILILKGDDKSAKRVLAKSLSLNPQNLESRSMLNYLERKAQ